MKKEDLRIVFMGTPDFAVPSIKAILEAGYPVAGVITAPDKPAGRGKKMHLSAIKQFALENNLPVLQPKNLKAPEFISELQSLKAQLQVVVAFRMLPEVVWAMPPLGTINLHASLLPQYRGAAPINHAIMNGERKTGLSTFILQKEIDTGHILLQEELLIGADETVGELHDRMMDIGAGLLLKTLDLIANNKIQGIDQTRLEKNMETLKPAPKILKEHCRIVWNNEVDTIHNFIRGLSPYPAAYTSLMSPDGESFEMKVFKVVPEAFSEQLHPGSILTDYKHYLKVACVGGFISLLEIQVAGKKRLNVQEFLRGFHVNENWRFL